MDFMASYSRPDCLSWTRVISLSIKSISYIIFHVKYWTKLKAMLVAVKMNLVLIKFIHDGFVSYFPDKTKQQEGKYLSSPIRLDGGLSRESRRVRF